MLAEAADGNQLTQQAERAPTVSIITPVRNGEATLQACRASVLAQSFTDWEHIFVDDGSHDHSRAMIKRFAAADGRVRLVMHDKAQGAAAARNAGIMKARGRFIAFLDIDDLWLPEKLEAQTRFMLLNGLDLSYGAYFTPTPEGVKEETAFLPPLEIDYRDLLGGCPIGCLTAMYDRQSLGTRLFPPVARGQDWALWLQIAREGRRIASYPGVHAVYHKTRRSLSSNKLAKLKDIWRIYRVYEGQSRLRSVIWLARHALFVAGKRRMAKALPAPPAAAVQQVRDHMPGTIAPLRRFAA